MAGFGSIDYRQLERTAKGISDFSNTAFRNDQMKVQVEQDQTDRALAEQGSKIFNDIAFGTGGQREFGQPAKTGGIGDVASGATPGASGVHDPEQVFRAAAQAGEILAKGGGRHTQAAAQRIHQYLDDYVKIKNLAPRHRNAKLIPIEGAKPYMNAAGHMEVKGRYMDLDDPTYKGPEDTIDLGEPPKPDIDYFPGENVGKKSEKRTVGNEVQEKVWGKDLRSGKLTGDFKWAKQGTVKEGGATGRSEALSNKYAKEYMDNAKIVNDTEERHGKENFMQKRNDLMKDPEATKVLAADNDVDAKSLLDEIRKQSEEKSKRADLIKEVREYNKALAKKESLFTLLNGMGIQMDEETGEKIPVKPKDIKKAKSAGSKRDIPGF